MIELLLIVTLLLLSIGLYIDVIRLQFMLLMLLLLKGRYKSGGDVASSRLSERVRRVGLRGRVAALARASRLVLERRR